MGDFSFLDDNISIRKRKTAPQQQSGSNSTSGTTHGIPGAETAAGERHQRIPLPSFREVQAAQRPSAPASAFQSGFLNRQQQLQQQQQQQQQKGQQPLTADVQPVPGSSRPSQPATIQQQQQQHPAHSNTFYTGAAGSAAAAAVAAAGQSLSLNFQLPRYNQAAAGTGAAAPIGIARAPPAAAGAAATAGTGSSFQQPLLAQQQQQQQPGVAGSSGGTGAGRPVQQAPPSNTVLVSQRQQGNPVLKHIRAVRWCFSDVVPDYVCGANTAVLFLSLRYHLLQPEYILHRLAAVQRAYRLLVVLLLVDVEEVVKPLQDLHKAVMGADAVLMCAWSNEECARYIESFKAFENKTASSIMERTDTDYLGRVTSALTAIRGINRPQAVTWARIVRQHTPANSTQSCVLPERSDAFTLASAFGSLAEVIQAEQEQFASCPGLGLVKAKRLVEAFNQPFKKTLAPVQGAAGAACTQQQQQPGQQQPGQQHSKQVAQHPDNTQQQQEQQPQGGKPQQDSQQQQQQAEYEDYWEEDVDLEEMYYAADDDAAQDDEAEQGDEGRHSDVPAVMDVASNQAVGPELHEFLPLPGAEDECDDDGLLEEAF